MKKCRLCGGDFFTIPIAILRNMPKSVLRFPSQKEKGITIGVYQCKICGLFQHTLPPVPNPTQNISARLQEQRQEWIRNFRENYDFVEQGREYISFNEIEHWGNLGAKLRQIHRKYDRVFVTVPNFRHYNEICADHLYYFTPKTIRRTFEINGFVVDKCNEINWNNDIMLWASHKKQKDLSYEWRVLQDQMSKLEALCEVGKVAIYGAGHRALTLLSQCDAHPQYIVDDTPSKQGKVHPTTGTPIFSGSALITDPVDYVIIGVPETYQEEVLAKLIKSPIKAKIGVFGRGIEWIN